MKNLILINVTLMVFMLSITSITHAFDIAPQITDREIVERLTRVEEGQKRIEGTLNTGLKANSEAVKQLRDDMNSQFGRLTNIMIAIFGAFVTLVVGIIWFALWDRRSMIKPFEDKTVDMEEEISTNRTKLQKLVETFLELSKTDKKIETILKKLHLL